MNRLSDGQGLTGRVSVANDFATFSESARSWSFVGMFAKAGGLIDAKRAERRPAVDIGRPACTLRLRAFDTLPFEISVADVAARRVAAAVGRSASA